MKNKFPPFFSKTIRKFSKDTKSENVELNPIKEELCPIKSEFYPFFSKTIRTFLKDQKSKNNVFSPISLYLALSIAAEISDGNTRRQILDLLAQENIDTLRTYAGSVLAKNHIDDERAKCIFATSLWTNNNFEYKKGTAENIADKYNSAVFSGDPASIEYNKKLQNWLNEKTGGLLTNYISNIEMSPEMAIFLASTVYFCGRWKNKFNKNLTQENIFYTPTGDKKCDFMNDERRCNYFWGSNFTAINLYFILNGEIRLILPNKGVSPEEILNDDEAVDFMLHTEHYANEKYVLADISVPKFDISTDIDLGSGLRELGISDIFDGKESDFSPLFENSENIFLSGIKQDTRILIDEEVCKAASITGGMVLGALPEKQEPLKIVFDRPFLFEIMSENELPLFVGIVNDPSKI